jgi:hypothetical protein
MNKETIISRTSSAVEVVESKLFELNSLTAQSVSLESGIAELDNAEKEVLSSDKSEDSKVKSLLSQRARRDVKVSALATVKADIAATEDELIQLGISADKWINAIRDGLSASRRLAAEAQLAAILIPEAKIEAQRLSRQAKSVHEIDKNFSRLVWVSSRRDASLANSRKVRGIFDRLSALVAVESEIEFIV